MSDQRSARTSPRRALRAAVTSMNVAMHEGPRVDPISVSCLATVSETFGRFLGMGGSLFVTGLWVNIPHRIALLNAEETRPAVLRTVFAPIGRD